VSAWLATHRAPSRRRPFQVPPRRGKSITGTGIASPVRRFTWAATQLRTMVRSVKIPARRGRGEGGREGKCTGWRQRYCGGRDTAEHGEGTGRARVQASPRTRPPAPALAHPLAASTYLLTTL